MSPTTRSVAQSGVSSVVSAYMRQVYQWMTAGLALTTVVAYGVANSPAIRDAILGNSMVMILLIVAQFGLVIALSAAIHKMSAGTATGSGKVVASTAEYTRCRPQARTRMPSSRQTCTARVFSTTRNFRIVGNSGSFMKNPRLKDRDRRRSG